MTITWVKANDKAKDESEISQKQPEIDSQEQDTEKPANTQEMKNSDEKPSESENPKHVKPVSRFRKMLEKLGKLFGKSDEQPESSYDENE